MTAVDVQAQRTADFAAQGYAILPGLIEPALRRYLESYARVKIAARQMKSGDSQVPGAASCYGDPAFEALLEHVRPAVEAVCGAQLLPTYSFFRIYGRGNTLAPHRDREACEISVSLTIAQPSGEPWSLMLKGAGGAPFAVRLLPGDAVLYRGMELKHWREPFTGSSLIQAFLHYVDRNGPYAEEKFDRRNNLMAPATRLNNQ